MKNNKTDVKRMAALAMMVGILLVMGMTGIGFIPLPVIKATTMHIPVILGAILLGPSAGAILGCVFGLCSVWANTTTPGLLAFAFSPFMSTTGLLGAVKALWISVGCRTLFGAITGWVWKLLKTWRIKDLLALPVTAVLCTLCHTILVMGSIYILLAQQYAQAKNVALTAVFGLVMGTVTASGIPEAIAAGIAVTLIGKALLRFVFKQKEK